MQSHYYKTFRTWGWEKWVQNFTPYSPLYFIKANPLTQFLEKESPLGFHRAEEVKSFQRNKTQANVLCSDSGIMAGKAPESSLHCWRTFSVSSHFHDFPWFARNWLGSYSCSGFIISHKAHVLSRYSINAAWRHKYKVPESEWRSKTKTLRTIPRGCLLFFLVVLYDGTPLIDFHIHALLDKM